LKKQENYDRLLDEFRARQRTHKECVAHLLESGLTYPAANSASYNYRNARGLTRKSPPVSEHVDKHRLSREGPRPSSQDRRTEARRPNLVLTELEIRELVSNLREVFVWLRDFRQRHRLAEVIQNPKLPSLLTESLVVHRLRGGAIPDLAGYTFERAGRKADILACKGNTEVKIEVKSTGVEGFQQLGRKDVAADYLIWLHLGDCFLNSVNNEAQMCIVRRPSDFFLENQKLVIDKLKQDATNLRIVTVRI
jgi:hypothetical protein